ncbi:MAG: GNAT family N-acetyltransferase [Parvibaculum sp.]
MSANDTTGYQCMPRAELQDGALAVRAVQPSHIESIRQWRNAQMDVLRQSRTITAEQQSAYYTAQVWPAMVLPHPPNILLIYEENGRPIGYGGLVHIAWEHRRAEVSFLLAPDLARASDEYARYFGTFLGLIKGLAFKDLRIHRLYTETYAMRRHHISILETNGFLLEGTMRHHVMVDGQPMDSLIHGCLASDERQASE